MPVAKRRLHSKGPIIIEDNVWIGENACILENVRIGKCSIIGANAVVTHDIPPYSVAVGVPAKVIKTIRSGNLVASEKYPPMQPYSHRSVPSVKSVRKNLVRKVSQISQILTDESSSMSLCEIISVYPLYKFNLRHQGQCTTILLASTSF